MCSFRRTLLTGVCVILKRRRTGLKTATTTDGKSGAPTSAEMLGAGGAGDSGHNKERGSPPVGTSCARSTGLGGIEPRSKVE